MMSYDPMKTTEDDRRAIEKFNQNKQMIQSLEDVASMVHEIIVTLDGMPNVNQGAGNKMGSLLVDMRESLVALRDKEAPESPDYAKPVVEAVSKLEKALSASIKAIDVKPSVKVDGPQVNIDLKSVEKILKGDIPEAFKKSIKLIPKPEKTDLSPLTKKLESISKQLSDIDTGVRMKPAGVNAKITNTASNPVPITGEITAVVDTGDLEGVVTDGTQKTQIVDSGGEAATVTGGKLDVNATASLAGESIPISGASEAVGVAIVDGSGNQITSFGGGTQYSDADANADPTGTVAMGTDGTSVYALHTDTAGDLQTDVLSSALPTGAATSDKQDTLIGHVDGVETLLGTIDADTSTLAATDFATEAKQDTGNTSLGSIDTKLPAQGQALAAASTPVVLPAAQITTLTPPAAITGFATESTLSTLNGKVTAVNTGAVVVSSSALPSGAATAAGQLPDGHNVTIDNPGDIGGGVQYTQGDTDASITGTAALMEVGSDTLQPVQGTVADGLLVNLGSNNDVAVTGTVDLGATDNAVLDAIAASTAAIDTDATTIIGHVDGIETAIASTNTKLDTTIGHLDGVEGILTTIDADTGTIATEVAGLLTDTELRATPVPVSGTVTANLSATDNAVLDDIAADTESIKTAVEILDNAISGNEMQVDVVAALPAGTNAIGKLAANSGVDIGDVDVTSAVSGTLDHGSNRDIDTTAEQITSTSFACKFGVTLTADATNTGILYIGNSDVTAGTTAATDGIPLAAGDSITLPVSNSNIPYAIASANNQVIYWVAV